MAKVNIKKKTNKNKGKSQKKLVLIILSCAIALSVLCSLIFGFKLYAYGKDVTILYSVGDGTMKNTTQVVEVCKSYKLETPKNYDREFLYWSTDGKQSGKVDISGVWLVTTKDKVVLYAVWGPREYTGNY